MRAKYDLGIVGCWYWGNYGSLLNGYATNYFIKNQGLSPLNIITPNNGFEPHAKKFFQAVYKNDDISELLPFRRVSEFNEICDMFLTGSDQIWSYKPDSNKLYDGYFRLDFAADTKRKISFATSLGRYNPEPEEIKAFYSNLYNRYDYISVRESKSVNIFKDTYNINVDQISDPVFFVPKDHWVSLAEKSDFNENSEYLLTYILDPTPEKRRAIEYYSNKLGLKTVNILDGFSGLYEYNKNKLNLPGTLPNICCLDFLKYFSNAKYIITDSFHGVCFSLIFNIPFLAISNFERGIDRFQNILTHVGLENRLIPDINIPLDDKYLSKIDFYKSNLFIKLEGKRAEAWFKKAIEKKNSINNNKARKLVSYYIDINQCTGCGACVSACPTGSIQLKRDIYGVYRSYIDESTCIGCGKCKEVCAALDLPLNLNSEKPIPYAFISANEELLRQSSSGGAFSTIAANILSKGGYVIGAAWADDFAVKHIIIDREEDLYKIQKSKYLQSYLGSTFKDIKKLLDNNKIVLFSGCPCQVTGLKKYLGKSYQNLLLIDILCANCPSSDLFKRYIEEAFPLGIRKYDFRYKAHGESIWDCNKVFIVNKDGETEVRTIENDLYLKVFHSCSLGVSSQCLKCKYQGTQRVGDITLGDCWGIQNYDKFVDFSKGVSLILVNNEKGKYIIDNLNKNSYSLLREEPLDQIKKYNHIAFIKNRNWKGSKERDIFLTEYKNHGFIRAKLKVDEYINSFIPPEILNLKVSNMSNNSFQLDWSKNESTSGYLIEGYVDDKWDIINEINDGDLSCISIKQPIDYYKKIKITPFNFYNNQKVLGQFSELDLGNKRSEALNKTKHCKVINSIIQKIVHN